MLKKQYQPVIWVMISFMFVAVLLFGGLLTPAVSQADLPDRNPPTPTPSNDDDDDDDDGGGPQLAYIELFVTPLPVGVESVVQWQDVNGDWNDVEGWKRQLQNVYERWTVEAKDFNAGPFRWVIRHGQSGFVVGTSDSFILPAGANQTVQVTIVTE